MENLLQYKRKNVKWAKKLINLTSHDVNVYENSSGAILRFPPSNQVKTDLATNSHVYRVVDENVAYEMKRNGESLFDVAIIYGEYLGRNAVKMTRLVWGEDPTQEVQVLKV